MSAQPSPRNEAPAGLGINGVIPGVGACVVAECGATIPAGRLMCPAHWSAVPTGTRDLLAAALRRWHRGRITLDVLRAAQWECVDAVTGGK